MDDLNIEIVKDIKLIDHDAYTFAVDKYIEYIKLTNKVKAVYQIGSVQDPGISDIDLVVVVEESCDPFFYQYLSVSKANLKPELKNLFLHDIYLHTEDTFKEILYINYCDNLKLCYGKDLYYHQIDDDLPIVSNQIIFDFIALRLSQFHSFLLNRKISYRGLLVRIASIKHSYNLLKIIGGADREIELYIEKVYKFRKMHANVPEKEVLRLFLEAFYYFIKIVELAASLFQEKYLSFYSKYELSNNLKLNAHFNLCFIEKPSSFYRNFRLETKIYYPSVVLYHYLAYTLTTTLFSSIIKRRLSYAGDEVFHIDNSYMATLRNRLRAIENHTVFLKSIGAEFSMKGNPGFVAKIGHENQSHGNLSKIGNDKYGSNRIESAVQKSAGIDKTVESVPYQQLSLLKGVDVEKLEYKKEEYEKWVTFFCPNWKLRYGEIGHKKLIELFISYSILLPDKDDIFMDAAGGHNSYIDRIDCYKKYLQVYKINSLLRTQFGNKVIFIEGDAGKIPLEDRSMSKICCHHSFEHFQNRSDIDFILEVQRLLLPKGKCCIIPIFIGDKYVEVVRHYNGKKHYDSKSRFIVDPNARITGGESCGDYARIYDLGSFQERIVDRIDKERFTIKLSEILINEANVPNMSLPCHQNITKINYPYRVLEIYHK